jgi:hypothetical protein
MLKEQLEYPTPNQLNCKHLNFVLLFPFFSTFPVAPMIWVQNQLEYAAVGRNFSLQCNTESFPPAIHYWKRQDGSAISSGKRDSNINNRLTTNQICNTIVLLYNVMDKITTCIGSPNRSLSSQKKCMTDNSNIKAKGTLKRNDMRN